jgi:hypothetical protein
MVERYLGRYWGSIGKLDDPNRSEEAWIYSVAGFGRALPDFELPEFKTGSTDVKTLVYCMEMGKDRIFGAIWMILRPTEQDGNIFERIGLMTTHTNAQSAKRRTIIVI